jgi:mycobactin polyketide synthetase MbtD
VLQAFGYGPLISQLSQVSLPATEPAGPVEPIPAAAVPSGGLRERLMKLLAEAIGVERSTKIDTEIPLVAIGLDSLQALELRRRVKIEFNHDLEVSDLLAGASISDVLAKLAT